MNHFKKKISQSFRSVSTPTLSSIQKAAPFALWVGVSFATAAYAQESGRQILEKSQRDFSESQRLLESAHRDYYDRLNDYYRAQTTKGPERESAIEQANQGLIENEKKTDQIISNTYKRLNEVFESLEFNANGVVLDQSSSSNAKPQLDLSSKPDTQKEPTSPNPSSSVLEIPQKRKPKPLPFETPSVTEEKKEVENADDARNLVFKKRKKSLKQKGANQD